MINPEAAKPTRNEGLKTGNPLLSGAIAQTLKNPALDSFTQDDYEFLKFHGVYQQDDRDKRKAGKQFIFMVRTKFPGGAITGEQYLQCDRLASDYGNNTLRITTRQDFQFHGVIKSNLRNTIKELNEALITTIAACGDVERNVMAPPTPATSPLVDEMIAQARQLSNALAPKTKAYHKIWLEGQELDLNAEENKNFVDPLYGASYLPRKFKTAFAFPPLNDIDIFTNDLGFVVIAEGDKVAGYNLLVGGGMGMSHGNAQTFPRLADVLGFLRPEHLEAVAKAVVSIHRDFGDRTNRKHARIKYVLEEKGAKWCRAEVEQRAGIKLEPARPFEFTKQGDLLGWHRQTNGNYFLGLFVENGRIKDADGYRLKSGLRQTIEKFKPEVRLTASQNLLLVDVRPEDRDGISSVLKEHGVSVENPFSPTRLASMACPALPTCGLSLAESERVLPDILTRLEKLLAEVGLKDEEIVVRMTGCPNGCARPYMAEIGFVGKAPSKYQLYLGGNESSTRLNRVYKDTVKNEEIEAELRPLLRRFAAERKPGERFGDFCDRVILKEPLAEN
ncbi:MAG TPA: NADPH-dependent assimilatory sulfite reductase hemoprotein subunit [Verrucomicrobiae bacterium]|nr:NADPH-dependent assimilatory sulfite reductase hemoprotein subunit [Verrucomicrobiae bacterium]